FIAHVKEQALRLLGDPGALADREEALMARYLSLAGGAERGRDSTDADGRFEIIGLLPGPAKMTVGQSWMKREFQADSVEALPRVVILERGGDLEVRVSVEKGGELPSSISGWARCADGRMCGLRSAIDEGVAFFENLPPGRVTVSFTPRGFELIEAQQQVIYPGRRNRMALHLVPLEHTELLVHVVSKADGRPVRGARILAAGGEGQGETGADGVAQLKVVGAPAGLSVSAPGFASYRLQDPEMAQKNRVKITLEPAGIVTVVVKDADGTPAAGVMTVLQAIPLPGVPVRSLHSGAEITSPGGVARFGGLCSGEYELICLLDQLELARERLSLRMAEEVESAVTLPRTFTISGVVRLGGEPVTSGRLTFSRVGAPGQASTGVGAQGDYQIRLLDPGDYRIHYQGEAAWQSPAPERLASYGVLDIDIP
ncbi:MAG: hypothetical protein ACE5GW_00735, partial [Planctomycetota bacterium]